MRQKIRRVIIIVSLLLFPVTLNYFSPYVSLEGATIGIVSGSLMLFVMLFVTSLYFGRAWCGWICPMAGLSETVSIVNGKSVNVKRLKIIRYSIFTVWAGILVSMFILAGGIKGFDPLYLTENVISVDAPMRYIIYYAVLFIFFSLTLWLGKRGACHSICWMSPFLVAGYSLGRFLKIPQLRIKADSSKCIQCGICDKKCPMGVKVSAGVKDGYITASDCILCGECLDGCGRKVFQYGVKH